VPLGETKTSLANPQIALIGTGNWGRHILRDLVSLGCTVHAVARSPKSIANAKEFGAATIVEEIDSLPEVDAAVIASLTTTHAEMIEAVAQRQAGPIYVEKPLCADREESDRLAAAYPDRLFVMDKWRYHPAVLELARIARSGEIGTLQTIQTRRVTTRNPHTDVNTVWTHAPHDLVIALEILGELPEVRFAVSEVLRSKVIGIQATLGGPPWVSIEISDAAPGHRREIRIVGDEGSAHLDGGWAEQVAVRHHDGRPDEIVKTPGELPLLAELRAFVEHIQGGPPPKSSAAEGALIVRRVAEMLELAEDNERSGELRAVRA
jgi:predicted dehydrogenase